MFPEIFAAIVNTEGLEGWERAASVCRRLYNQCSSECNELRHVQTHTLGARCSTTMG